MLTADDKNAKAFILIFVYSMQGLTLIGEVYHCSILNWTFLHCANSCCPMFYKKTHKATRGQEIHCPCSSLVTLLLDWRWLRQALW